MDELPRIGHSVPGLMRAILNVAGIPWAECERWGAVIDDMIVNDGWLTSDNGTTWNRAFDPTTMPGHNPNHQPIIEEPILVIPSSLTPELREALRQAMLTQKGA